MVDQSSLLDQLKSLLDSQWKELIFRLGVDEAHLHPGSTSSQRSIELIRLFEQQENGWQRLQDAFHNLVLLQETTSKNDPKHALDRPQVPFLLPKIDIETFTGRLEELQQLESQLLGTNGEKVCSIVGLSGGGGMGKSALAFHFATKYKDRFPDGVIGLPVDGKAVRKVAREFARLCGEEIDEEDGRSASTIMQEVFAHRRMLLIFDNADRADLKALRPGGQCCALIVTTRDRSIPSSFGIPNQGVIDLPVLPDEDARNLLRNIVGERVNDEPEAVNRIIEMTGKLPLALEIAGSTLEQNSTLSFSRYAEYLNEEEERLKELETDSDIELNVTASLNLSLKFLENSDIDLFACLSVCAKDGFSLETAMKAGGLTNQRESRRLLNRLYRLSLLNAISEERYVSHILVRIYAQDLARKRNLWDAAAQRHAEYFLYLVQSNDVESPEIAKQIAEDFSDILQAAQWLRATAASDELKKSAYQFALDLRPFLLMKYSYSKKAVELMAGFQEWAEGLDDWTASVKFKIQHAKYLALEGSLAEAESILRKAQDSIDRISDPLQQQESQAKQLSSLGGILQKRGERDEAIAAFEREIKIDEALNDQSSVAIGLNRLGGLWQQQGNTEAAIAAFERQIKIAEALNDQRQLAIGLNCLGGLWQQQGNTEAAIAAFERQISISEALNGQRQLAIGLNRLGGLWQQQGNVEAAIAAFERQIKIAEALNDQRQLAIGLNCLGGLWQQQRNVEAAIAAFEREIKIDEALDEQNSLAIGLNRLGGLWQQQGNVEAAITAFERQIKIAETLNDQRQLAIGLNCLGGLWQQQGNVEAAIAAFERTFAIEESLGNSRGLAMALSSLSSALRATGDLQAAILVLERIVTLEENLGNHVGVAMTLRTLGSLLRQQGDLPNAIASSRKWFNGSWLSQN